MSLMQIRSKYHQLGLSMPSETPIQMIQTFNIISDGAQVHILFLFFIKFLERVTRKSKTFLLYISTGVIKNLRFSLTVSKYIICC